MKKDNIITYAVDYETFYDKKCSIRTLGPIGYFSHPDFDAYLVSVVGDNNYEFVGHPKDFDWSMLEGNIVLSHNASFDESLYLYGVTQNWWPEVTPAAWYCTADMAAAVGLPRSLKGATERAFPHMEVSKDTRNKMMGKVWGSMTEEFQKEVEVYALADSTLCLQLWKTYGSKWSDFEREISGTNRRAVQRGIPLNADALKEAHEELNATLFETEKAIPWMGDKPLLSRKAYDEECIKHGLEPPASLAATDAAAQAWVKENGRKHLWIAAVSNWRRINSLKKKLEAFDHGLMSDGRYYGGLMYFGGHTGRFSGGGGNLNLQNLPRADMFGINMRNIITAPKGKKLVVVDLSQIEVRTLCWLAGDTETMARIAETDDIYEAFAIQFGLWKEGQGVLKVEAPETRRLTKNITLGCFGPETLVLTTRGWIPIVGVRATDTVWDGKQWTKHEGLLHQGVQETLTEHGVEATASHEILTEHGWREWSDLLQSEKVLKSALSTASLPSSVTFTNDIGGGTQRSHVRADGEVPLTGTTSSWGKPQGATCVRKRSPLGQLRSILATPKSSPTRGCGKDSSTGSVPYLTGATTQTTRVMSTMAHAGYGYVSNGLETAPPSSNIWSVSTDTTSQISNSTELTTTKVTSPETSVSSQRGRTWPTGGPSTLSKRESKSLKRRSEVYDLKNCGPNNRFTILSDRGPLIVHNCGYGCGAPKFAQMTGMTLPEAEEAVELYRTKMKKIPKYWRQLTSDIRKAAAAVAPLSFELPSGRTMDYGLLKSRMYEGRPNYVAMMNRNGKRTPMKLWGGVICENLSQGLARDVFCYMMLQIEKAGIKIIFHVHDEVVIECDEEKAEEVLAKVIEIMSTPPPWIADIPLSAEGDIVTNYTK